MSSKLRLVLLLAVSLIASACYRVNFDIEVENDNSARVSGLIALDSETFAQFGDELGGGGADQICDEFQQEMLTDSDGGEVEAYRDGSFCGVRFSTDIPASADLQAELQSEASDVGSATDTENQELTIEKIADDEWNFTFDLGDDFSASTAELEDNPFSDAILGSFEFVYTISLPGAESTNNADSVSSSGGKTKYVWNIGLDGGVTQLQASTVPGEAGSGLFGGSGDGTPTWIWILGGLVLLGLIGGLLLWILGRNKGSDQPVGYQQAPAMDPAAQQPFQTFDQSPQQAPSQAPPQQAAPPADGIGQPPAQGQPPQDGPFT